MLRTQPAEPGDGIIEFVFCAGAWLAFDQDTGGDLMQFRSRPGPWAGSLRNRASATKSDRP